MKKLMFVLLCIALPSKVLATAQYPDILIYKGETKFIFSNPLESYFGELHPRPNDIFKSTCSANWRGYVATWKIEGKYLYLVKLIEGSCGTDAPEIPIEAVFSQQNAPIEASWFSGTLRIPLGKRLIYVHMGYGSIYEKELFLTIENGKLIQEELIDNSTKKLPTRYERTLEELRKLEEWEKTRVLPR